MRLIDLYEKLDSTQRKHLAEKAGVDAGYLWQIGTHWNNRRPSVTVIQRLVDADRRLTSRDLVAEFAQDREPVNA